MPLKTNVRLTSPPPSSEFRSEYVPMSPAQFKGACSKLSLRERPSSRGLWRRQEEQAVMYPGVGYFEPAASCFKRSTSHNIQSPAGSRTARFPFQKTKYCVPLERQYPLPHPDTLKPNTSALPGGHYPIGNHGADGALQGPSGNFKLPMKGTMAAVVSGRPLFPETDRSQVYGTQYPSGANYDDAFGLNLTKAQAPELSMAYEKAGRFHAPTTMHAVWVHDTRVVDVHRDTFKWSEARRLAGHGDGKFTDADADDWVFPCL